MSETNELDFRNVFGLPIQYKGINIHPVKIIDCQEFYDSVRCLLVPKNKMQDIEIIKMSYLKFILVLSVQGHPYMMEYLQSLMKITLKADNITFAENDKGKLILNVDNKYQITESDFDKIKKVITEQNLIQIDEQILDPELEQKIKEAKEFLQKRNGKMADLEQQIVAYHCAFKMPYEEIGKLTIYQFHKGIERMNLIKTSDALQGAMYSGMISIKDDSSLPNWLSYIENNSDPYKDVLMSKSEFDSMASKNGLVGS